jgi:hypothetical protein
VYKIILTTFIKLNLHQVIIQHASDKNNNIVIIVIVLASKARESVPVTELRCSVVAEPTLIIN